MRRGAVAGLVGFALAALAGGIVLAPATVLSIGPVDRAVTLLASRDPRLVLVAVGALAGLVALVVSRGASTPRVTAGEGPHRLASHLPESAGDDSRTVAGTGARTAPGSTLDARIDGPADAATQGEVRAALRATAVRRLARLGEDAEAARRAVEAGEWTDDELAAAFLGEGTVPLSARVRAWLDPAVEHRRRVERTVAAIEALGGDR